MHQIPVENHDRMSLRIAAQDKSLVSCDIAATEENV